MPLGRVVIDLLISKRRHSCFYIKKSNRMLAKGEGEGVQPTTSIASITIRTCGASTSGFPPPLSTGAVKDSAEFFGRELICCVILYEVPISTCRPRVSVIDMA